MQRREIIRVLGCAAAAQLGKPPFRLLAQGGVGLRGPSEEVVLLNQLGYLPRGVKVATIRGVDDPHAEFQVRSAADHRVVLRAPLSIPRRDSLSGDLLRQAEFSSITQPGTYRLSVADHSSDPFPIRNDVYRGALLQVVRGYQGQRCGCEVELGEGYQHPPCHQHGEYADTSGKSGVLPNGGGWHDAGDYGRYIVNSGITCGTLLWAWEMYPAVLSRLDLDHGTSPVQFPAFLKEVLWNLTWMLQLQDADGGVFHKQTSKDFCGFVMPQDDYLVSEVIGTGEVPYKSTCATADLAAVMAIASRCYRAYDASLAARFETAAAKAWQWAVAHPDVTFRNPPEIRTGEYGDQHCEDEIAWASAELWRTTGNTRYESAFLERMPQDSAALTIGVPSVSEVASMACWSYAMADQSKPAMRTAIQQKTLERAHSLVARGRENGYANSMVAEDYIWGSNAVAANQSLLLLVANRISADLVFVTAAMDNLHYVLGRNCFGVSWVTQLGVRPFMNPHHRPSIADGLVEPWPGLLSGGPNPSREDPVAMRLPDAPPMRMWVDDHQAYSLNEIAINWNAPLVFLLAAANTLPELAS